MEPKTEIITPEKTPFAYKKGDKVNLSYNGEVYPVTVKSVTVIGYKKEYCIQYEDGSTSFVRESAFEDQVN